MPLKMTQAQFRKLMGEPAKPARAKRPPSPERLAMVGVWAMAESAKVTPRRVFVVARLKNPTNTIAQRGAFFAARRETAKARADVAAECLIARVVKRLPVVVKLTRLSAGTMDAHDNLRSALKPIADGVADYFGAKNDRDGFKWKYDQQTTAPGCFGCVVEFSYPRKRRNRGVR